MGRTKELLDEQGWRDQERDAILDYEYQEQLQYSVPANDDVDFNRLIEIEINGKTYRGPLNRVLEFITKEYTQQ